MDIDKLTIEDLEKGFCYDEDTKSYICNTCQKKYQVGEIYVFDNRFFEASRAIQIHIEKEHEDYFQSLLYADSKYNTLTENQRELLLLIHSNISDKEIAKKLGVSPSTVRHQRFMFREKAKQAKMYLAIYEQAMKKKMSEEEAIMPVHSTATMVDDRYVVTEKEKNQIIKTAFTSLSPLQLKEFPAKEKKKIVVLTTIAEQLEYGKKYTENELNQFLKEIYDKDYAVLRRYLIAYGFMERTKDGSLYWLKSMN